MGYFKTALGLETPEPGNSPAITNDLKKLAEGVDTLLRKQLTMLVELGKLKVTEKIELPKESITEEYLKKEAVTGPKLGTGTVRQETGTTQSFMSWGVVSSSGTIEASSGDFTVSHEGTGKYLITWNKEKGSEHYAVTATPGAPAPAGTTPSVETNKANFRIQFLNGTTNIDNHFTFIAIMAS